MLKIMRQVLNDLQRENHTLRQRVDAYKREGIRQEPSLSFGGDASGRNSILPPRPSTSYYQKLLGASASTQDQVEEGNSAAGVVKSTPNAPHAGLENREMLQRTASGISRRMGQRQVQSAHTHRNTRSDQEHSSSHSAILRNRTSGDAETQARNPSESAGSQNAQTLMAMPPEQAALPPRPSTVPSAAPACDADMVFSPGMPVPSSDSPGSPTQRGVTFAELRARDSQLGFGSVASSGILGVLDTRTQSANGAGIAAVDSLNSHPASAANTNTRHSSRPSAARPHTKSRSAAAAAAAQIAHEHLSPPRSPLPARPRTVGSGFRSTSAIRGSVAMSERNRIVSSSCSELHSKAAANTLNTVNTWDCDGRARREGAKSPEMKGGTNASAQLAAAASMGIDVQHVQRQVRAALQHGGELVVEVGSVLDPGNLNASEMPKTASKGMKGRPEPATRGLMKELLGSHSPNLGRESTGRNARKR